MVKNGSRVSLNNLDFQATKQQLDTEPDEQLHHRVTPILIQNQASSSSVGAEDGEGGDVAVAGLEGFSSILVRTYLTMRLP
jgi:hypothetical protein